MPRRCVFLVFILLTWHMDSCDVLAEGSRSKCAGYSGVGSDCGVLAKRVRSTRVPSRGDVHALVIFTKFRDEAPSEVWAPDYAEDLFDPDLPGSFSHFYREMSCGQLSVSGTCLRKRYTSLHNPAYYLGLGDALEDRVGTFTREILTQVDDEVDFGGYDNDGPDGIPNSGDDDGYVDFLFLNLLSAPPGFLSETATGIVSLGLTMDYTTDDPAGESGMVRISDVLSTMQRTDSFSHAAGVMAHEFGHGLGLSDLYDVSFLFDRDEPPEEDSAGIGKWGLMGRGTLGWNGNDGPNPMCAWSREQLGWIGEGNSDVVDVVEDMKDVIIRCVWDNGKVYRIPLAYRGNVVTEYFLVEHRTPSCGYYDRHIPGSGLLIWHVTPAPDNAEERYKRVDLECADGLFDANGLPDPVSGRDDLDLWAHDVSCRESRGGNLGDAGDLFDGERYTAFGLETNPSSDSYDGNFGSGSTGFRVESIRRRGEDMVVDFHVPTWAGRITGEVVWRDTVHVIGDVVVEEGATLILHRGTQVWIAPNDATSGGVSPDRCEIDVHGGLDNWGTSESPVVFSSSAAEPGDGDWYGIRICPGGWVQALSEGTLIQHAERGMFWEERSEADITMSGPVIRDQYSGNEDGRANPGETFELEFLFNNLTPDMRDYVSIGFWPDDPFISSLLGPMWTRSSVTERITYSDQSMAVSVMVTIASDCPSEQEVGFVGRISKREPDGTLTTLREEQFTLRVHGVDKTPPVVGDVSGQYVPTGKVATIRALVTEPGPLRSVMAEIVSVPDSVRMAYFPLSESSEEEGRYIGTWSPPLEWDFVVQVEATDARGNVGGIPSWEPPVKFSSRPFERTADVLVYVDLRMRDLCERALRSQEIPYDMWDVSDWGILNEETLKRYSDGVVIWASDRRVLPGDWPAVCQHLEQGGGLLLLVDPVWFPPREERERFFSEVLSAETEYRPERPTSEQLTGVAGDPIAEGFDMQVPFYLNRMSVQEPAVPIVVDESGNAAVARVEQGSYRVVYVAFYIMHVRNATEWDGLIANATEWLMEGIVTAVRESKESAFPSNYVLYPGYPNPFNPETTIRYDLPEAGTVRISLYNISGQRIRTLLNEHQTAGTHSVAWDGTDDRGRHVANGVYLCRMKAGRFQGTRKVLLVK